MAGAGWLSNKRLYYLITKSSVLNQIRHFSRASTKNMKFTQFTYKDKPEEIRVGYVEKDGVVDINKNNSSLPSNFLEILKNGVIDKVKKLKETNPPTVPFSSITLKAPIHGMDKIICIGLNYKDHCQEQNLTPPEVPMFFCKFASTIIGPDEAVKLRTDITQKVDWEVELTAVIGKKASNVKASEAYDYVAGYTVAQDISARDWQKQKNGGQFLLGKSMDNFCPIGPYVVTGDEVGDPQALDISCSVNGVLKQQSNTCQLINKLPDAIERLSSVMTLLPGDLLLTGTPGGVGMYRQPPEYLQPGDEVISRVQNVGELRTLVARF